MTVEQKILISLYEIYKEGNNRVSYEDLIVQSHKLFPDSFSLKSYPEFPDSHVIYSSLRLTVKTNGFIDIKNKMIKFTEYGLSTSEALYNQYNGLEKQKTKSKENDFSANEKTELRRLLKHKGFQLYLKNDKVEILDIDIYDFFEISVRTSSADVKSRFSIIKALMNKALKTNNPQIEQLFEYKNLLIKIYEELKNGNSS